jgi:hypothetical protein
VVELLAAEFGVGIGLRGMSVAEVLTSRDPVSGTAYYFSLALATPSCPHGSPAVEGFPQLDLS